MPKYTIPIEDSIWLNNTNILEIKKRIICNGCKKDVPKTYQQGLCKGCLSVSFMRLHKLQDLRFDYVKGA